MRTELQLRREEQQAFKTSERDLDIMQMAKAMGNQAVMQMTEPGVNIEDICTGDFIRKHIKCEGKKKESYIPESTIKSDYEKWKEEGYIVFGDPSYPECSLFFGKSGNLYGVRDKKISHYTNPTEGYRKAEQFSYGHA